MQAQGRNGGGRDKVGHALSKSNSSFFMQYGCLPFLYPLFRKSIFLKFLNDTLDVWPNRKVFEMQNLKESSDAILGIDHHLRICASSGAWSDKHEGKAIAFRHFVR